MFADPILIIAYNKPLLLKELLDFVSHNTSSDVYIHLDGPTNDLHNSKLNSECREIINEFSLRKGTTLALLSPINLGGQFGVLAAIDWFFDKVEFGLIIEEDIEVSPLAFDFISEKKQELNNPESFAICLFNPIQNLTENLEINHWLPWGWAAFSSKWKNYRPELENNAMRLRKKPKPSPASRFPVRFYLNRVLKKVECGEIQTWDAQVHLLHIAKENRSIFPHQTLSKHRGFIVEATHADLTDWWKHLQFPPALVKQINRIDRNYYNIRFEHLWRMSWFGIASNLSYLVPNIVSIFLKRFKR